jgi:protein-S-isoprenylcysteine O-methyltransferase Ste14
MPEITDKFELVIRTLGAIAGIGTFAFIIFSIIMAQSRPTGITTGAAKKVLKTSNLIIATVIFCGVAYLLWKPVPIQLTWELKLIFTLAGGGIYFGSLLLYLWGLRTLGSNFNASTGLGVRLLKNHQLVRIGPFAFMRHPMYLAVILACWSGFILYRTWTMLVFAVMMFGLVFRAKKEEEALEQVFGEEWKEYKRLTPGWVPRIRILKR